ncbi:MAG TPA: hypothetical protein VG097_21070 [Gemmata sp.]|jgi:hypothetical protein|nr:hypothetical protein [Gemmata sp.]
MPTLTSPVQLADRLTTEERFRRLVAEWKEQARYLSDTRRMVMLRPYQSIIGMGLPVVPLILEELLREPHFWFWALEMITEENPVPENARGDVQKIANAWITWGRRERLIT